VKGDFGQRYKIFENVKYLRMMLSVLVILWGIWRLYCYYIWTTSPDLVYGYLMVAVGDLFFITSLIDREELFMPAVYSTSISLISFGIFSSLYIPHVPSIVFPIILGILILVLRLVQKDFFSILTLTSSTLLALWAVYRLICYFWWKFSPDLYYGIGVLILGVIGIVSGETAILQYQKIRLIPGSLAAAMGGLSYFYLRNIDLLSGITSLGIGLIAAFASITPLIKVFTSSVREEETTLCYYCGAEIPVNVKICPNCGKKIPICPICDVLIQAGEKTSQCPHCKTLFHKEHLDTWLMVRSTCPVCREKLR